MVLLGSIARVALITVGRQTALRMEFVLIYSQVKVIVKHGFYAIVHIVLPQRFQSIYRLSSIKTSLIAPMGPQQLDISIMLRHGLRLIGIKSYNDNNFVKIYQNLPKFGNLRKIGNLHFSVT